jgi:hypothetical protein
VNDLNNKDLTNDEITFTLWAVSFIGSYWYHNDSEKKVHLQYFMDKFIA